MLGEAWVAINIGKLIYEIIIPVLEMDELRPVDRHGMASFLETIRSRISENQTS